MFLAQRVFLVRGHPFSRGPDVFNWRWLSRARAPVSQQAAVCVWLSAVVFSPCQRASPAPCVILYPLPKNLGEIYSTKVDCCVTGLFLSSLATECVGAEAEESPCSTECTFHCISSHAFQLEKWALFASTSLTLPTHLVQRVS